MKVKCLKCQQEHSASEANVAQLIQSGVTAYVDTLCPWCRVLYNIGKALNSPLGVILCGMAIGAVLLKSRETLN